MDTHKNRWEVEFAGPNDGAAAWPEARLAVLSAHIADWQPDINAAFARFEARASFRPRVRRGWVFAAVVAAAVTLFAVAYPSPAVLAHRCLECSLAVLQSLTPSKKLASALTPVASRALAPDFTLEDSNGAPVRLSDLRGKVVLVNFWATWCHGCQLEIPWLVEFQKQLGGEGLAVVGVSTDADGWTSVRPWLKQKSVNYPVVIGDDALAKRYGVTEMPVTALVDRDGRVAELHCGMIERSDMRHKLETLLHEPQTP